MKWRTGMPIIAALAVESVNFFLLAPPIDVGYPSGTPWYIQLIGLEWVLLHWPTLFTLEWFESLSGCRRLNIPGGCGRLDAWVLFFGGFLDTAVLFLCLRFAFRWFARRQVERSSTATA